MVEAELRLRVLVQELRRMPIRVTDQRDQMRGLVKQLIPQNHLRTVAEPAAGRFDERTESDEQSPEPRWGSIEPDAEVRVAMALAEL